MEMIQSLVSARIFQSFVRDPPYYKNVMYQINYANNCSTMTYTGLLPITTTASIFWNEDVEKYFNQFIYHNIWLDLLRAKSNGDNCANHCLNHLFNAFVMDFILKVIISHYPPDWTHKRKKIDSRQSRVITTWHKRVWEPDGCTYVCKHFSTITKLKFAFFVRYSYVRTLSN